MKSIVQVSGNCTSRPI